MATEDYVDQAYADLHDQWNRDLARLERADTLLNLAWLALLNVGEVKLADEIHAFLGEGELSGKRTDG